ncbi:MAG: hypothetical protein EA402_08140 [Planctomycetota bacterium]|nr:MAG: hypothetical protein EA402_08140 [Planctomycetota bacterium]
MPMGLHPAPMDGETTHFLAMLGAIAPVFLVIAVGRLVAWKGMLGEVGIQELTRLLYWVCLPALLIDRLGRDLPPAGSIVSASMMGVFACVAVAGLMLVATRDQAPAQRGAIINGAFRMNGAFVGLPVIALLATQGGPESADLSARYLLIMAVMVPFTNALAVLAFLIPGRGVSAASMTRCLAEVLRNPIIIASALGVAIAATIGSRLAESPPGAAITFLGDASIPLALLLAGATLDLRLMISGLRRLCAISAVKLLLAPALGWGLCWWWELDLATTLALVVLLGSPTAVSAVPMARQLGGDERLLAAIVVTTTLFAPFTLLLWLMAVAALGS